MKNQLPQILKGFRDYLPQEQIARNKMITKISETFERFGFAPMDTPTLEPYELLGGKYGEEGEQLMYKFQDQGDRKVAMRYDLTVPLARVVSQYKDLPKPFKRYQMGNVWRADKPQKGRYREFLQCDVDVVGSSSQIADAEVIATINAAFKSLNVGEVVMKFNNRQIVDEVLSELKFGREEIMNFLRIIDKLDKIGEQKLIELLEEQGFRIELTEYRDLMQKKSKKYVEEFGNLLSGLGVANIEFEPFLARGLDYYTGLIFEFILKQKPEYGSIAGGGRYDNLIGKFSGAEVPAVGGSIGVDRLLAALEETDKVAPQTAAEVIVFNLDKDLVPDYLNMVTNLRNSGIDTDFYYETAKLDKQFKYAETQNMQVAVIFGAEEAGKRKVNLKDLREKKQVTVDLDDLITQVKSMLW